MQYSLRNEIFFITPPLTKLFAAAQIRPSPTHGACVLIFPILWLATPHICLTSRKTIHDSTKKKEGCVEY